MKEEERRKNREIEMAGWSTDFEPHPNVQEPLFHAKIEKHFEKVSSDF